MAATGCATGAHALQMQSLDAPAARAYAARCGAAGDGFHSEVLEAVRAELTKQGTPPDPAELARRMKPILAGLGDCPYCGCAYADLGEPTPTTTPRF